MSRGFFRQHDVVDSMCDAYLDGRLDLAQQNGFEHLRALDPRLEAAIALHQDVDASLQRTLAAPDLSRLCGDVEALAAAVDSRTDSGTDSRVASGSDSTATSTATAPYRDDHQAGRAMSWVLAAAALLLMCLSVFFSSGTEPGASSTDIQVARVLPTSLAEVAVIGVISATAFLVQSLRARRERRRVQFGRATTATVLPGRLSLQFAGTLPR